MAKMDYSDKAFSVMPMGRYKAKCINAFLFESEFQGKKKMEVLLQWSVLGPENGDNVQEPPTFNMYIGATYNPKSKKARSTKFVNMLFGRELSEAEFSEFDTDYLIGVQAILELSVKRDPQSGDETGNECQAVIPRETLSIAQLMQKWEANGKPVGQKPEWLGKNSANASAGGGEDW